MTVKKIDGHFDAVLNFRTSTIYRTRRSGSTSRRQLTAIRDVTNGDWPTATVPDSRMNAKTVPIEDIDGRCNCLAVAKAARYLRAAYDKALAPLSPLAVPGSIDWTPIEWKSASPNCRTVMRLAGFSV